MMDLSKTADGRRSSCGEGQGRKVHSISNRHRSENARQIC